MSAILFSLMILFQGIPFPQGGTVTGVLRDSKGVPVANVRMAAVAFGDALESSMVGLAETDAEGRFTLQNIPPGRYVIAAGRLDLQTYYPGTQVLSDATVLTISAGTTISGIQFSLSATSTGRAYTGNELSRLSSFIGNAVQTTPTSAAITVRTNLEYGGVPPITANGKVIMIRVQTASGDLFFPIARSYLEVPLSKDLRLSVEGLPDDYKVKSITAGGKDITNGSFEISPSAGGVTWTLRSNTSVTVSSGSTIVITLSRISTSPGQGVSVWGHAGLVDNPTVFISGKPGTVFSDGSFHFRDVPPGRHLIAAQHNFTPQAAAVVVGDKDVFGIALQRTLTQADVTVPASIPPAGDLAAGTVIPLPRILGTVVDDATGKPVSQGLVTVENESYRRTFGLDANGSFESLALFPGTYDVTLWVLHHVEGRQRVTVEDKDVPVKLTFPGETADRP